jgi:hypothetical protein
MRAVQDKEILGEVGTALHSDLGYAADAFPGVAIHPTRSTPLTYDAGVTPAAGAKAAAAGLECSRKLLYLMSIPFLSAYGFEVDLDSKVDCKDCMR